MAHEAGKGSSPRPFSVDTDEYAKRWDAIFGKKNKEQQEQQQTPPEHNSEDKK
jgi:hypothetical protein